MTRDTLIDIPTELFAPAESSSYAGQVEMPPFDFGPDSYVYAHPVTYAATITNVGGAFLVTGSVACVVRTSCARCLEDASFQISGELEGYFLIEQEGEDAHDLEEDEFDILPEDHRIDLEPLICAAILVELPAIPLCREDCAGLCVHCGANLNEGSCDCAPEEVQEEHAAHPFAALRGLTFD